MSSWRKSASSRLSSFKGYIAQQDLRNTLPEAISRQIGAGKERAGNFKEWAGQKINRGYNNNGQTNAGTEKISLFPGWAARRYPATGQQEDSFEIEVFISGFATSRRSADVISRSQRAFLKLAKGKGELLTSCFAALPKLESNDNESATTGVLLEPRTLSHSTEDLLKSVKLPPRPEDISEDYEVQLLERKFQSLNGISEDADSLHSPVYSQSSSRASSVNDLTLHDNTPESSYLGTVVKNTAADELRKLHANLESRLQPFWSSVVPNRTVRLRLYTSPNHISTPSNSSVSMDNGPVSIQDVVTAPDGSFQARFTVGWTDLANHPGAEHIAFGDPAEEHELLVAAELLPLPSPISSVASSAASSTTDFSSSSRPSKNNTTRSYQSNSPYDSSVTLPSIPPTTLRIPLTYSPVRVISDIDDTIKYSNVTGGARAVFHNVFVKELKDLVIPGMGEWYEEMWKKGVRFHYVSNGPFELLPLIGEFFQISKLPPGSVKLRSYAGKSLFSGLLSAPSARKRAGVLEILDAFPDSRFILIGDSGEQDLELYTDLARERADQVLAIFIRDTGEGEPLSDPTGDSYDKIIPPRSAPSSFDAPTYPISPLPGNFFNSANSHSDSRPPSRSLTPLSMNAPYTARSRKTPVSGGGPKSADYFNTKPLTAEPDPLIDFGDSPTTAQSASSIARPLTLGSSVSSSITPWTPATTASSVTPKTPKTPWLNHSNASYTSYTSFKSNKRGSVGSIGSTTSTVATGPVALARMTESEKKGYELQMRVYKARGVLPFRIMLRVFREPGECVETWDVVG
ncbi:uncharacterized protein C8R40DRAFT_1171144 [Lentinula edodes]|uniref:uncharacterized protein n=1 Tax=Lentinula edodes TaxID=5353 RepID=UPI001E8E43E7|nr:uncharacterized protein C8R40DRAFT_1171144 [Lentinula edodes]KAH7874526.1 hypothetical protein C8R40DRAFT_1171144 [Lentinula edodes]